MIGSMNVFTIIRATDRSIKRKNDRETLRNVKTSHEAYYIKSYFRWAVKSTIQMYEVCVCGMFRPI